MSADRLFLQRRVRDLDESPAYQPISRVRIHAGEDGDGNPIIYEAGNTTGRTIEVDNPLIMDDVSGRTIAANVLAAIQGYAYKPYKAGNAILDPAAEIGDAVSIDEVYSVLADIETTFSPLMTANIGAREDGTIDHEYPYESSEDRQIAREIQGIRTSFIVENGRITTEIANINANAQGLTNRVTRVEQTADGIQADLSANYMTADQVDNSISASIQASAQSITSQVSRTYELKTDAAAKLNTAKQYADSQDSGVKGELRSEISQTADSIKATVAGQESKWDVSQLPSGVSISAYGYGIPSNTTAAQYRNQYYLDQTSGRYYKSNGTSWVLQTGQLELITNKLQAALNINSNSISSLLTSSSEHGNAISSIEQLIDNITLSVSSDIYGHAKFEIGYWNNDAEGGGGTYAKLDSDEFDVHVNSMNIYGTITATAVAANSTIESPRIYGGLFYGGTSESPRGALQIGGQGSYGDLTLYGGSNSFHEVFKVMDYIGSTEFYAQSRLLGTYSSETNTFYAAAGTTWYFANANVILPS